MKHQVKRNVLAQLTQALTGASVWHPPGPKSWAELLSTLRSCTIDLPEEEWLRAALGYKMLVRRGTNKRGKRVYEPGPGLPTLTAVSKDKKEEVKKAPLGEHKKVVEMPRILARYQAVPNLQAHEEVELIRALKVIGIMGLEYPMKEGVAKLVGPNKKEFKNTDLFMRFHRRGIKLGWAVESVRGNIIVYTWHVKSMPLIKIKEGRSAQPPPAR